MQACTFGWNQAPYAFCTAMKTLTWLLRPANLPTVEDVGHSLKGQYSERCSTVRRLEGLRVGKQKVLVQELDLANHRGTKPRAHWLPYIDDYLAIVQGATKQERMASYRLRRRRPAKMSSSSVSSYDCTGLRGLRLYGQIYLPVHVLNLVGRRAWHTKFTSTKFKFSTHGQPASARSSSYLKYGLPSGGLCPMTAS
eukprot:SAG31_NODE_4002_length_3675_cov_2.433445_3_plen_196_part_00